MRSGLTGWIAGMVLGVLAFVLAQRVLVAPVAEELVYRFSTTLFSEEKFPPGDLENGRLIRRCLLPVRVTTTFYDAGYHEVKQAEQPGRYGAVVRIDLAGTTVYRFVTLYRIPQRIHWDETPLPIRAELPPQLGFDPAMLRAQHEEIGRAMEGSFIDNGNVSGELAVLCAGLAEMPPGAPPMVERTGVVERDADWWFGLRQKIGLAEKYPYLVDLPEGYGADANRRWPLILALGNADDRGHDLGLVRQSGLTGLIARGKQIPAVVISPQCPSGEEWDRRVLWQLIEETCAKYAVDRDRIYVTGISAGGDVAWQMALAYPDRLAAVVPICGDTDPADAARAKDLPIWAFHGVKDDVVPVGETTRMIAAIRQAGGHPHMTLFPDAEHDSWDDAYATAALYPWLLAQKRGQPEVMTPGVPGD